ncbi:hypothetical protein MTR_3g015185 [Medicago truncatula]|uniref:Uncharacterized protein n=1 Tax=Medicago truncatula TaxID=3880 RepID=A0A072UUH7_MEDTR|nr:hypothetical protein MTR_3g015185 [Medicago truncatula]
MSLDLSNNPKTREVYSLTFIVDKEKKRENIKVINDSSTTIPQAKDLNTLALEYLIGLPKTHETILQEDKPIKNGKMIALEAS